MSDKTYYTSEPIIHYTSKPIYQPRASNSSTISNSSGSSTGKHYSSSISSRSSVEGDYAPRSGEATSHDYKASRKHKSYSHSYSHNHEAEPHFYTHSHIEKISRDSTSSSWPKALVTFERSFEEIAESIQAAEEESNIRDSIGPIVENKADPLLEIEVKKKTVNDRLSESASLSETTPHTATNFKCIQKGCGMSYFRAEHLCQHQLDHTPEQIYNCKFPDCTSTFVRQDLYIRHQNRHAAKKGQSLYQKTSIMKNTHTSFLVTETGKSLSSQSDQLPPSRSPSPPPPSHEHDPSRQSTGSSSHSLVSSDFSSSFETDSACSAEETDVDEGNSIWPIAFGILDLSPDNQLALANSSLTPMKQALIDRVMKDFWIVFNQEWSAKIRTRAGSPSSTSSGSTTQAQQTSTGGLASQNSRKQREYGNDGDSENGDQGPNSRKNGKIRAEAAVQMDHFACPYRKHDPRKYNHRTRRWRTCALGSFNMIARVKGHLYRHHKCFQCERCGELFEDDEIKKQHFMALKTCDLKSFTPADGITMAVEKQLRSRKKRHADQTPEERWKDIYQILFPLELIPSPYFDAIQDIMQPIGPASLSNYEEFSRQELPRVFRSRLEAVINEQAQPIEDGLRSQLVSMIQESQNDVFSAFRVRLTNTNNSSVSVREESSLFAPAETSSDPTAPGMMNWDFNEEQDAMQMLQTFYQEPPYQSVSQLTDAFGSNMHEVTYTEPEQQYQPSSTMHTGNPTSLSLSSFRRSDGSTVATSLDSRPQIEQTAPSGAMNLGQTQSFTSMVGDSSNAMDPNSASAMNENAIFMPFGYL